MRLGIFITLMLATLHVTYATEVIHQESITLKQVIDNVLEKNPQIGINNYENKAAAARTRQAQQTSPLRLKAELENFVGTGSYKNIDQMETTLSLIKILESDNALTSRSDLARQQARQLLTEQDRKQLDLLTQAAEQFIHVVVDQHRLEIAKDYLRLVQRTYKIVSRRVKAGKSHVAEQRRFAINESRAEIELEHAEHELSTSRLKLTANWGETQPLFGVAEANLFDLPQIQSFETLAELIKNNPDLVRFANAERISQARLRLARSRRAANFELSAGISYFNEQDDAALAFSVSMPFGSRSQAQPKIDEMNSLSQLDPLMYEQQRILLYTSLYEIYQELSHARTAYKVLNNKIIPEAQNAANDYEQGYKTGRFSLLELNEAQQILLDARLEAVMAAAKYHRLKIEIERLTGSALQIGEKK